MVLNNLFDCIRRCAAATSDDCRTSYNPVLSRLDVCCMFVVVLDNVSIRIEPGISPNESYVAIRCNSSGVTYYAFQVLDLVCHYVSWQAVESYESSIA